MRGTDHIALGIYFISSTYFLIIPISVWCCYTILILSAHLTMTAKTENTFLSEYWLLPLATQWKGASFAVSQQLMPVYLYGIFLIALALKETQYLSILILCLAMVTLTIISIWHLRKRILQPNFETQLSALKLWTGKNLVRPFFWFSLQGTVRKQLLTISGYKLISLLLIIASIRLCESDPYDIRLPGIFVLFSFALNVPFILEHHRFENGSFPLYRQMPFTLLQRYAHQLLTFFIFTFAEAALIMRNIPLFFPVQSAMMLCVFGLSVNMLFCNYLYIKDGSPESKMPFVYFCTITFFMSTLANIPLFLIAALNLIVSFFLLRIFYYRFEYHSHKSD